MLPNPAGRWQNYAKEKFIFVLQDVRGQERLGRDVRPHAAAFWNRNPSPKDIDESTDAYDTIDWLVKHIPNNNGKVGMMGISYPGFYSACGMIDSHPALKCVSPQAPIADWFIGDDFHHNGAFYLPHNFRFFATFGQKLDDPTARNRQAVRLQNARRLRVLSEHGPDRQRRQEVFQGQDRLLERS